MGEIIQFPVGIIPFPVLKLNFEPLGSNDKHFVKEVFYQRPGSVRNDSISVLKINFEILGTYEKHFVKEAF